MIYWSLSFHRFTVNKCDLIFLLFSGVCILFTFLAFCWHIISSIWLDGAIWSCCVWHNFGSTYDFSEVNRIMISEELCLVINPQNAVLLDDYQPNKPWGKVDTWECRTKCQDTALGMSPHRDIDISWRTMVHHSGWLSCLILPQFSSSTVIWQLFGNSSRKWGSLPHGKVVSICSMMISFFV